MFDYPVYKERRRTGAHSATLLLQANAGLRQRVVQRAQFC